MSYFVRGTSGIERGPEPGAEPSWEEMLTERGTLHGDFGTIARQDFTLGLTLLGGFMKSLPEDKRPGDIEGLLDLVDWSRPEDRQLFLEQYQAALSATSPQS